MRTTIDLPQELHALVAGLARHTGRSMGQVVAELLRRGLDADSPHRVADQQATYRMDTATGLPVVASQRPVTEDDVRALDDDPSATP